MKRVIYSSIIYMILVIVFYFTNIVFHVLGTSYDWIDFATYFAGMVAPITAIVTLYITYLLYKLNDDSRRMERYFERIVDLYWKIQETHNTLCVDNKGGNTIDTYEYKIKMQVQLMRYYLKRFPDMSHSIKKLDLALNDIWFEPMRDEYYDTLEHEFDIFCFYANSKQIRPIKPVKDNNGKLVDVDF